MADNVGILVDIDFEDIKAVQAKFKTLLSGLKNNKIDIDVNIKDIGIQLSDIKKNLDKLGANVSSSQEKINKETVRAYKNTNDEIIQMLRDRAKAIEDTGSKQSKVSWLENEKGNIKSATIEYTDGIGKIQREMYNLQMTSKETENTITQTFSMKNTGTKFIDNIDKADKQQLKLNNTIKDFELKLQRLEGRYGKAIPKQELQEFQSEFNNLKTGGLDKVAQKSKELSQNFQQLTLNTQENAKSSFGMSGLLGSAFNSLPTFLLAGNLYNTAFREIREGVTDIIDLDTAMTNLKKVTDETDMAYSNFLNAAHNTAIALGGSSKSIIDATSEFARLGYSMQEASKLGETALIYQNVGDIQDITKASASMISTMSAFNVEAENSMDIIDKFNKIGNEFSISSEGIGTAFQSSASALKNANNTIDESIALITSANKIIQNPDEVGSAWKTISMRLRMVKDDAGELEANMRSLVQEISGVDIMFDENNFKSTYQIMLEIGKVWDTLQDKERALLAEKIAGKNRANVFMATMENWKELELVAEASVDSQGSAMEEYQKYLDSLEAKINIFQESLVKLFSTSIDNGFIGGFIEGGTGVVNIIQSMTESFGGLPTAIGLATGATVLFNKQFREAIFGKDAKNMMSGLIDAFKGTKAGITDASGALVGYDLKLVASNIKTIALTASSIALQAALTMGISLAIGGVITLLTNFSKSAERAQQKVETLKTELSDIQADQSAVSTLGAQYDELVRLKKEQGLNNEEQREFTRIQNELKNLLPTINGHYSDQGDFLISASENMESFNKEMKEYLGYKREELANAATDVLGGNIKRYEKEADILKKLSEYSELYNKSITEGLTKSEGDRMSDLQGYFSLPIDAIEDRLKDVEKSYDDAKNNIHDNIRDIIKNTDAWKDSTEEQRDAMLRFLSEQDGDTLNKWAKDISRGGEAANDFTKELSTIPTVMKYVEESTKKAAKGVDGLNDSFEMTEERMEKLTKQFTDSSSEIQSLAKAIEELDKYHELSASTVNSLVEKYPELIKLLGDEKQTRKFLMGQIEEQERIHKSAIFAMIEHDETFFNNKIKGNEHLVNELKRLYGIDIENFNSLAEAKAAIEEGLINAIGRGWAQLYKANNARFQSQKAVFERGVAAGDIASEKALMGIREAERAMEGITEFERVVVDFTGAGSTPYNNKPSASKAKKATKTDKSQLPKYLTQGFDDVMKEILAKSDKLEREIEQANAKILNAQLLGNTEEELALHTQLEGMYAKRIELEKEKSIALIGLRKKVSTELSKQNFDVLKGINLEAITEKQLSDINRKLDAQIDKANKAKNDKLANNLKIQQDMINEHAKALIDANSNINSISLNVRNLENENIEKTIALIEKRYELEDKLINNRIRDIDVEMMLTKDGSADQLKLQKQKYDEQLNIQNNYLKRIKEYREQEIEMDAEVIQKQIDGWHDAERERLNMLKSMGEQAKKLKLDSLNTQQTDLNEAQKATQTLVDMVMKMLKQQYAEEKALIQENSKAKEDAIKKELDGYKKIIDEKKKSLREEKDNKNYDKELKAKQKSVADIENKILVLSNDNSKKAQAERLKLESEKLKLIDELNEFQENRSIELQEKALDEELARYEEAKNEELKKYKDQKDAELKILDDHLSKEGNLRAEAIRLIEGKNKDLYDKLIKWNAEYSTGVDQDIKDAWDSAYDAMENYNGGQLNVLDTLGKIADKLKEVKADIESVNNSSWQDYTDPSDISPDKSKFPVYDTEPDKKPDKEDSKPKMSEKEAKELIQKEQQRYFHSEASKAKETGNKGLLKWVQDERKKWGMNSIDGSIEKDGVIPSDAWNKHKAKYGFLKGGETKATGMHWLDGTQNRPERVLSPEQTQSFNKLVEFLPNVVSKLESFDKTDNSKREILLQFDNMINVEGNLDEKVDIVALMRDATDEMMAKINKALNVRYGW